MDYETVCYRLGLNEWPSLKERIDEPDIQASIQTFMAAFDDYAKKWKTYQETGEDEGLDYAEWCGHMTEHQLSLLVDNGRWFHKPVDPYDVWIRKNEKSVPLEKELPSDVLDIIRQYSKPAFLHFREYNQALALFDFTPTYKQLLKEKIGVPLVQEQLKICVDSYDEYHKLHAVYLQHKTPLNEELLSKAHYWADVSKNRFVSLIDEKEYYQKGYAAWYFQDEMDDAWRDSDDELTEEEERLAIMSQDEEMDLHMMGDQRVNDDIYDGLDRLYPVLAG